MSISVNIQAAVDAAFQAVSVRLAHVTAPARRDPVVLAMRKRRQPEESCSVRSSRTHYESYVFAARPWTEVPQDALITWVALPRSTRHSSVYQSWRRSSCASKVSGIHGVVTGPATDPCCSTLHCAVAIVREEEKEISEISGLFRTKTIKKKTKGRNSGI